MIQHTIHNNKLYNKVDNDMFTTYQEIEVNNTENLIPEFKGKKIPRSMWKQILSFMKHSYDEFDSETLVYLFYDETSNTPWSWWVPPQETHGMSVSSLPDHPDYKKQRKLYPDVMFGTVHHHCSVSAFQSGTDESDEENREGIHFTIGNMDEPDNFDIHCRITIGGCHSEIEAGTYIEQAESPFKKTAAIPDKVERDVINYLHTKDIVTLPTNHKKCKFETMSNVKKKTYTSKYSNNIHSHQLGWHYGTDGIANTGTSFNTPPKFKKKEKAHTDIASELVNLILTDYEYEDILIGYYNYIGDHEGYHKLYTGETEDSKAASDLSALYDSEEFLSTEEGKKAIKLTEMFLKETSQYNGVDNTIEDIKHGLRNYQLLDDNRERFQLLDTEDVF